jgi:ADP-dependent NAD(P)H-hydrate dehydratase / NAD(P)H-hydrate epimerase
MRDFDAHAVSQCHVPSLILMENAGVGAAAVLVRELLGGKARGARVALVCGTGNNGGDGLVVARQLAVCGALPIVFVTGDAQWLSPDARTNFEAWRGVGGQVREVAPGGSLAELAEAIGEADVIVDAIFGTGLDRPIEGPLVEVIQLLNRATAPRFAIDLPSGLDADTGATLGVVIEAQATATFAHRKLGLLTPNGALHAGRVHVVDIGVPASLVGQIGSSGLLLDAVDAGRWVGRRAPGAHKTSAGHVLIVAGSAGKVGAPQLVAHGALRAGAGLATIATWPEAASAIEATLLEAMTARIDRNGIGATLDAILQGKQSVVVGPGLGLEDDSRTAVEYLLATWHGPVVVDADALSMFAGRPSIFMAAKNAILTPHPGEAGRLLNKSPAQVESERFRAARELVAATGAVVVLKGAHTIVASPDGRLAVSPVACPALGTAGSGDLLGGVIGALVCGLPAFEAACAGVLLHGLAGEAWSEARGGADRGLLASEIGDLIPSVRLPAG